MWALSQAFDSFYGISFWDFFLGIFEFFVTPLPFVFTFAIWKAGVLNGLNCENIICMLYSKYFKRSAHLLQNELIGSKKKVSPKQSKLKDTCQNVIGHVCDYAMTPTN
jgi:hypothetical protein